MKKRIVIIAGPNGAGKTTFAREFLPNEADCPLFFSIYKSLVNRWVLYDNTGDIPRKVDLFYRLFEIIKKHYVGDFTTVK